MNIMTGPGGTIIIMTGRDMIITAGLSADLITNLTGIFDITDTITGILKYCRNP